MSDGPRARPELRGEDLILLGGFTRARQALGSEDPGVVEAALAELEGQVGERLTELRQGAEAVADANARGVEILQGQIDLNEQLRRQNEQLQQQQDQIQALLDELVAVGRSLRDGENVEGTVQQQLAERSTAMMEQAVALAEANVHAVTMLEERETALLELKVRAKELESTTVDLETQATVDALTGLFNHRYFVHQIEREIARAQRHGRELSLAFVDLDKFKPINDQYGHQAGDRALKLLGEVVQHTLRTSDLTFTPDDGEPVLARYGGDEFVVILPETPLQGAGVAMARVRTAVRDSPFPLADGAESYRITVSVGVASMREGDTAETLVARADSAVYEAKEGGRDRVVMAGA